MIVLILPIVSLIFTACNTNKIVESPKKGVIQVSSNLISNQNTDTNSFDVDVKISYKITLDDKVKKINSNIIKAARQAIFDSDCGNAKFSHYNYSMEKDIYIFEVNEAGSNIWQVKFWEKAQNEISYNKTGYCSATVEKQKTGSFRGYMVNPGGPCIRGDETY